MTVERVAPADASVASDAASTGPAGPALPRVAFVAGGGAVKAYAYHLGVLRGLAVDGFHFRSGVRWDARVATPGTREIDIYVGSSAGACAVAALAGGHGVERQADAIMARGSVPVFGYRTLFVPVAPNPLRYARRLARRWRLGWTRPWDLLEVGGLFSTAGVERYFRETALPTNRFADLSADLYLVATQVNNARKVAFGPRDSVTADGDYDATCAFYDNVQISHALAAAIAVPPVFLPYGIVNPSSGKRFHYYDGEVREPVSADIARVAGADFVIISSIWSPYVYDERVGNLAELGVSALGVQALHQAVEQKVLQDRHHSALYDELMAMIAEHDASCAVPAARAASFQRAVRSHLQHRPMRTLYVTPDPADHAFFFSASFFRFNARLLQRCIDTGFRAYRRAVADDPQFLVALDESLEAAVDEPQQGSRRASR